jgi:alpha-glucosidase
MKESLGDGVKWWQTEVVYQIYPRSFMDGNGDGVGDLKGILSKLDYLNDGTEKSLGIDAIWLTPIYPSPGRDFGYDISDYRRIDPRYGNLDDFKLLLREAHDRQIRIVMDLVINHTSDRHPWFREACKSRDNPHHDWYLWHEGKNGRAPNNWFAAFDRKAWWWVDEVGKFYLSTWCRYQPAGGELAESRFEESGVRRDAVLARPGGGRLQDRRHQLVHQGRAVSFESLSSAVAPA